MQEYQDMAYGRITGMLKVAAHLGYEVLILGAFGCGAFANDAHVVSDLFYKVLKESTQCIFAENQNHTALSFTPNRYYAFRPDFKIRIMRITCWSNDVHITCQNLKHFIYEYGNIFVLHLPESETHSIPPPQISI